MKYNTYSDDNSGDVAAVAALGLIVGALLTLLTLYG